MKFLCAKNCYFCCLAFAYFCFVRWFLVVLRFCVPKYFLKKKISLSWFCLDSSISVLLMCIPLKLPKENYFPLIQNQFFLPHLLIFFCVHFFLFVRTSFYLSEPILICQNLFLFVKTCFHLCASIFVFFFLNLFLFMVIFKL